MLTCDLSGHLPLSSSYHHKNWAIQNCNCKVFFWHRKGSLKLNHMSEKECRGPRVNTCGDADFRAVVRHYDISVCGWNALSHIQHVLEVYSLRQGFWKVLFLLIKWWFFCQLLWLSPIITVFYLLDFCKNCMSCKSRFVTESKVSGMQQIHEWIYTIFIT